MRLVAWLAAVAAALLVLHLLASWAESRGWIFYRRRKPTRSALGNAFLEVQSLLEPDRENLVEVRRSERAEEDDAGGPPETDRARGTD